jgi:hypothetical protein
MRGAESEHSARVPETRRGYSRPARCREVSNREYLISNSAFARMAGRLFSALNLTARGLQALFHGAAAHARSSTLSRQIDLASLASLGRGDERRRAAAAHGTQVMKHPATGRRGITAMRVAGMLLSMSALCRHGAGMELHSQPYAGEA